MTYWGDWVDYNITYTATGGAGIGSHDWHYYDPAAYSFPPSATGAQRALSIDAATNQADTTSSSTWDDINGRTFTLLTGGAILANQTAMMVAVDFTSPIELAGYLASVPWPEGALDRELESTSGVPVEVSAKWTLTRLGLFQGQNTNGIGATLRLRATPFTFTDISGGGPLPYTPTGAVLWEGSPALTGSPVDTGWFDVTSVVADGLVIMETSTTVTSFDVPTASSGAEEPRGYQIAWAGATTTGTFKVPRVRYLFNGEPPPTGPTHAPPLRLWPRSDGLGLSSAVRVWPPPRSQQRSIRPLPGAYL